METLSGENSEAAPDGETAESLPPWMQPDVFFESPAPDKYGYYRDKWTYDCTLERLVMRLEQDKEKTILLVWTPGSRRVAPPEEFPELVDAVRKREEIHQMRALRHAAFATVVWGLIAWSESSRPGRTAQFHLLLLLGLGVIPFIASCWRLSRLNSFTTERMSEQIADARYNAWMVGRSTPWTWALLTCVGLVGLSQYLILPWISEDPLTGPIRSAGIIKEAVRSGEVWRLLTGAFLHGNPFHLFFNVAALVALSKIVEVTFHRLLLPLVFISSALVGSLCSMIFLPHLDSVGSSGGIMGLMGFILAVAWLQGRHFPRALRRSLALSVVFIAGMGIVAYQLIDNAAHAGGLLAGMALGYAVTRKQRDQCTITVSPRVVLASVIASGVIAATTLLTLYKVFSSV